MQRYVAWQNTLHHEEEMRTARFVEIPSLMQTGLYTRRAMMSSTPTSSHRPTSEEVVLPRYGCFRDDKHWAVDSYFWLCFFAASLRCGKMGSPVGFKWRQHPGQQTRRHGRLSISNLRRCKCQFLVGPDGYVILIKFAYDSLRVPIKKSPFIIQTNFNMCPSCLPFFLFSSRWTEYGLRPPCAGHPVEVWSMGSTLQNWVTDLKSAIAVLATTKRGEQQATKFGQGPLELPLSVRGIEWKPGRPLPFKKRKSKKRKKSKKEKSRDHTTPHPQVVQPQTREYGSSHEYKHR